MSSNPAARPNVLPWPPMLYGAAILLAILAERLIPLAIALPWAVRAAGGALTLLGVACDLWAVATLHGARTTILPHRAATRLITHGPFRFTRNPIYVGNTIAMIGLGVAFAAPWVIVFGLVAAILVDRLAIRREEAHLAARFGAVWAQYCRRTPRWLGRAG
ncbi:MAG: isoprenylcysteine carboxylmethyltransferase family protein [Rhodospirillales bacterium]|nr:isoprenylcysteine carboxylmethyltransferase family protein [Rhodospirillales bacterium]